MATCITCEEEYSDKRLTLGYETCLDCGQADAVAISRARTRESLADMTPSASSVGNQVGSPSDFSPDELFETRPGYNYDWRRKVSDKDAVAE
jgi:hypothetical protein|tara:strand:+ start:105 stop:380 length:276 start_codon:yes stop_codon:yes gene_type:complete